jgi:hypothetical protein
VTACRYRLLSVADCMDGSLDGSAGCLEAVDCDVKISCTRLLFCWPASYVCVPPTTHLVFPSLMSLASSGTSVHMRDPHFSTLTFSNLICRVFAAFQDTSACVRGWLLTRNDCAMPCGDELEWADVGLSGSSGVEWAGGSSCRLSMLPVTSCGAT